MTTATEDAGAAGHPFFAGPVYGIRVWAIEWRQGDGYLRGLAQAESWCAGGRATKARCLTHRHRAPSPDCACGLYAYHPDAIEALVWPDPDQAGELVVGVVAAWGAVEVHRDGFRAQYARPVLLARAGIRPGSDRDFGLKRIAQRYGAEVVDADSPEELVRLCRAHGYGLSPATVAELVPAERPAEDPDTAGPAGGATGTDRSRTWGEWLEMVVVAVVTLAWWGFVAFVVIGIVVALISGSDDPGSPFRSRHLEIVDDAITRTSGRPTYVAVVRNTSKERTALAVFARGRLVAPGGEVAARIAPRSRADNRPTLLPGERGTVVVPLTGIDRDLLGWAKPQVEVVARRDPAPRRGLGVRIGRARLDPRACRIVAPVELEGSRRHTEVEVVIRDRRDRIVAAALAQVGRLKGPRDRLVLTAKRRSLCRPNWASAELYPHVLPDDLPTAAAS